MKELIVYEFNEVRFIPRPGPTGEPVFLVEEIAKAIGHRQPRAIARMVDDDEKGGIIDTTLGRPSFRDIVTKWCERSA